MWNFGNVLPRTYRTFGKDAQSGMPNVARFAGTSTSAVLPNPEFAGVCAGPNSPLAGKRWGAPPAGRGAPAAFGIVSHTRDYRGVLNGRRFQFR